MARFVLLLLPALLLTSACARVEPAPPPTPLAPSIARASPARDVAVVADAPVVTEPVVLERSAPLRNAALRDLIPA